MRWTPTSIKKQSLKLKSGDALKEATLQAGSCSDSVKYGHGEILEKVKGWHFGAAMLTISNTVISTESDGALPGHKSKSDAGPGSVGEELPVTD